ncbi:hypothetical protein Gpo141_00014170 [Globisporangium polare]
MATSRDELEEALGDNSQAPAGATAAVSVVTPAQALALAASVSAATTAARAPPVATTGPASVEKKRRARGKNFQAHEDRRLCATWLRVCTSGSNHQPQQQDDESGSFWERACTVFNGDGSVRPEDTAFRSYQALQSRWSALQKSIATFGEIYDHVKQELVEGKSRGSSSVSGDDANEDAAQVDTSGDSATQPASAADKASELTQEEHGGLLGLAQSRYAERHRMRSKFTSLPCWELLRETPTWQKYVARSGRGTVRPNSRVVSLPTGSKKDNKSSGGAGHNGLTGREAAARPESAEGSSSKKRRAIDASAASQERDPADTGTATPLYKQSKLTAPDSEEPAAAEVTATNNEPVAPMSPPQVQAPVPKGGGFLSVFSPPVAFAPNEDDQFLQWSVRENRALPAGASENGGDAADTRSFALFDDNRRIETLVGGVYELNLYLEPQGGDASKYFLEVNGNALSAFQESVAVSSCSNGGGSRRSSLQPVVTTSTGDEEEGGVPFKAANVAQVQLNKWDMIALRRKAGTDTGGKTPFARFIIEFVRNS